MTDQMPRRAFLRKSGLAVAAAAVTVPNPAQAFVPLAVGVGVAVAEEMAIPAVLSVARVFAGFIFNHLPTVMVRVGTTITNAAIQPTSLAGIAVKSAAVGAVHEVGSIIIDNGIAYALDYFQSIPDDAETINTHLYQKAVVAVHPVQIGMTDEEFAAYRAHSEQIVLSRDEDLIRFEQIVRYLHDRKTRIMLPGQLSSSLISAKTTPEQLIHGRMRFDDKMRDYQNLLEATQVDVFAQMRV